jgi:broad specificity phosphatase PhoE
LDALQEEINVQRSIIEQQQAQIRELASTIASFKSFQRSLPVSMGKEEQGSENQSKDKSSGATAPAAKKGAMVKALEEEDAEAREYIKNVDINDRRLVGLFDARYHSTSSRATPKDFRILPKRIILVRHAESEGNVDNQAYTYMPDPQVPLTKNGWRQALDAGSMIKEIASDTSLFFYTSPYLRSKQTYEGVAEAFGISRIAGVQEEVQLREQDFGNFQDAEGKQREKAERLRFGRFFYRFPNGESGADVYDRMTLFEDHLVRDINAGRFAGDTSLVLVTHGLAARIFLMRWFHWTVAQFMKVYNPPNAVPLVLERILPDDASLRSGGPASWIHTKALYKLSDESMKVLQGCTVDMCTTSWAPRGLSEQLNDRKGGLAGVPEVNPFMEDLSSDAEDDRRTPTDECQLPCETDQ